MENTQLTPLSDDEAKRILMSAIDEKKEIPTQSKQLSDDEARNLLTNALEEKKKTGGAIPSFISGALRGALINPARAVEHIGAKVPGMLGMPFRAAQAIQRLGIKPIDPTQKFVGRPSEIAGEVAGSFAIPTGAAESAAARTLPRLLRAPAIGAAFGGLGGAAQGQQLSFPEVGRGAELGGVLGGVAGALGRPISKLAEKVERSALGSRMGNLFRNYMGKLRGDLSPEEAENELSKVATQREKAVDFMREQQNGVPENQVSEHLRDSVIDLDKNINKQASEKYKNAYSLAEKGGDFGITFPTASKSAKNILQREKEFSELGVPKADVDKTLGTVRGIASGGIKIDPVTGRMIGTEKDPITGRKITSPIQQTFKTSTETIKRLKEMAYRLKKENNKTPSSLLNGLAADVEKDTENALAEKSPEALSSWKDANNFWRRNALPLRTKNIQDSVIGGAQIGDLHKDLLNQDNIDLPNVINQLDERGKKALAFKAFQKSIEHNQTTEQREANPTKLLNIFGKTYGGNKPFLKNIVGENGIADLEDMQRNKLIGINENIDKLSKGLSERGNAQKIARLPQNDRNLILFNHLKDSMTPEEDIDTKTLIKKLEQIHPTVRNSLTGTSTEGKQNLDSLENFSRSELAREKVVKKLSKPKTRQLIKMLGMGAAGFGGAEAAMHGERGVGGTTLGLALLPLLPASVRENIAINPAIRLAILRALQGITQRAGLPISSERKPLDLTLTRGTRR